MAIPTEPTRAMSSGPSSKLKSIALVVLCGTWYIASSCGLIAFNKHLMDPARFPFPAALGLLHTGFCSLAVAIVFLVRPDLFTSLTDPEKKVTIDGKMIAAIFTIAALFTLQIVLSNFAYLYVDVAFLQMIKETNLVWVYLMSVAFGMEIFKMRQGAVVAFIVFATCITVKGELAFDLTGFLLQGSSCIGESFKMCLTALLLTGMGKGLDPLSYMLLVMPLCAIIFASTIGFLYTVAPGQHVLPIPGVDNWIQCKSLLVGNVFAALSLNLATFVFIRVSSAVAFVMAGILKDVMIVMIGVFFMGHLIGGVQASGFALQVSLVFYWSLLKTFPREFESGWVDGIRSVLCGGKPEEDKLETSFSSDKNSSEYGSLKQDKVASSTKADV